MSTQWKRNMNRLDFYGAESAKSNTGFPEASKFLMETHALQNFAA